jgi:hypothetical protein
VPWHQNLIDMTRAINDKSGGERLAAQMERDELPP